MTTVREAIEKKYQLARMRQGQEVPEFVPIPSMPEMRVALVPLTEGEVTAGVILSAQLDVADNMSGYNARNRAAIQSDCWHAMREPSDSQIKVFTSIEDMMEKTTSKDIDFIHDRLSLLMDYASPAIDGLTDEDLNDLKKDFVETDWSVLTGQEWAAVKLACMVLSPALLQVKLLGISSTSSSTKTNESGEST